MAGTAAGIGWLYLLRDTGSLAAGPSLPDALPLQRLAGGAAQPLVRFALAWLPAGLVMGLVLAAAGYGRRVHRAALAFIVTALLLIALGAAADAVTASESVQGHLASQPQRLAPWLAAALAAIGAALPPARRRS